ncbi:MAG: cupredoxin domain-containing protein [Candidatus Nitrosopolaris sp.]
MSVFVTTITVALIFLIYLNIRTPLAMAQNLSPAASKDIQHQKTFYLFTEEMEALNETKLGIPADYYIPNILVANEGDTVTIHYYNLDAGDKHSFTIANPYNINKDLTPLQNTTFTFNAKDEGVYKFYDTSHLPTMTGQLIVLPPSR